MKKLLLVLLIFLVGCGNDINKFKEEYENKEGIEVNIDKNNKVKYINAKETVDVLKNTITKQETTVKQVDKVINIALIQETVAKYFKLTLADLNGKKRNRNIAFPRQIAMFLAREMTDASLPRIGGNFGGRDHTTVMHAHYKIKKQYQDNPKTASVIDEIRKLITS